MLPTRGADKRIKQLAGFSATSNKGLRLAYGPATQQFGELYLPEASQPSPVVVLIHGGFWHTPYRLSLMTGLATQTWLGVVSPPGISNTGVWAIAGEDGPIRFSM
ncbi:MAG: hypothetical protein JO202_00790 [Ktedonobacteraceae bacterium]|nr:hypothetical protein [Ktedonobacteraceae bacterium]